MDRLRTRPGFRRREVLLLGTVAIATAASLAFAGFHLRQSNQTASASEAVDASGGDHLPDIRGGLCLGRDQARL